VRKCDAARMWGSSSVGGKTDGTRGQQGGKGVKMGEWDRLVLKGGRTSGGWTRAAGPVCRGDIQGRQRVRGVKGVGACLAGRVSGGVGPGKKRELNGPGVGPQGSLGIIKIWFDPGGGIQENDCWVIQGCEGVRGWWVPGVRGWVMEVGGRVSSWGGRDGCWKRQPREAVGGDKRGEYLVNY